MKTIIINLIREDIKQTQFIQQLNNLGFSADQHLLNLSPIIFDLMELDRLTPQKSDEVQNRYQDLILQMKVGCDNSKLKLVAIEVYNFLEAIKLK